MTVAYVDLNPISNKADWSGVISLTEDGLPLDATGLTDLKIELENPQTRTPELTASYAGGTVIAQDLATGTFTFNFPEAQTAKLDQQWYFFAGLFLRDGGTFQLFRVKQNTYDGIVG